jgi:sulfotransferase
MHIKKVFYNSSLPRSGSTLIQNILGQNPSIHTTPTSGIFEMLMGTRTIYTDGQEFKAQDPKQMENGYKGFLKSGVYGFYEAITDKSYVIDKSRGWGMEWKFINEYDPDPKIICMVRDLRGIFASLEKKYRKNPMLDHHIANWQTLTGNTTEKRIQHWQINPPTGQSLDRLYQVFQEGISDKILFVKFENLCTQPNIELKRIYNYFDLPYYQHDFDNIQQITHEDDSVYGVFGDHKIRHSLELPPNDYKQVLGEVGCNYIVEQYKWFYEIFNYTV